MIGLVRRYWRREVLYAALAAMEICWFWSWLALLIGSARWASLFSYAALLLLATYVTRIMHAREVRLNLQRVVTALVAVPSTLLLIRLVVYDNYRWSDWAWIGAFGWELASVMQRISAPLVVLAAGLYLWFRAISLAQRDIGVDSVGFSFRAGIAAFFWLFLVQIAVPSPRYPSLAVIYFLVGLLAVGLSRIEGVSHSRIGVRSPFDASWMAILLGSVTGLLGVSAIVAWLVSWRNLLLIVQVLRPASVLIGRLLSPLATALAWLLEQILDALIRFFSGLFSRLGGEQGTLPEIAVRLDGYQQAQQTDRIASLILQVLKWGLLALVLGVVIAFIAFSVDRLRNAQDEDSAEQSATWESQRPGVRGDGSASGWHRLWDALQEQLARLRGEDYSLISIRRIYASLQHLAAAAGYPRPEASTPYEYLTTLAHGFQESEADIRLITEAYVRTHYGQRSFPSEYVQEVRNAWMSIRARQEQAAETRTSG